MSYTDVDEASHRCRVCGWLYPEPPWGADGRSPLFEYCPCCGVEFGYQDSNRSGAARYRDQWLAAGAPWSEPSKRPDGWSVELQLEAVPPEFQ